MKNYGIILASGTGSRYGSDIPKQFVKIAGKTILEHTIDVFEKSDKIDEILVVITPEYRHFAEEILIKNNYKKVTKLLNGGEIRKESSFIGISAIEDDEANVLIHDCARPFLTDKIIQDCIEALNSYNAVDVAIPSTDTIVQINDDNIIENIPLRAKLRCGQTPQCFKLSTIKKAHELSKNDSNFTDDCGLIVKYNLGDVYVVNGSVENIKITYPSDIFMADRLFQIRSAHAPEEQSLNNLKDKVIVIFGGTGGIGKATADLAKEYGAIVFPASDTTGCDVSEYNQVETFLNNVYKKAGKIDLVINSAGVLKMGKLETREINDIKKEININYIGAINIAKTAIPYLKATKGSIQLYASSSYTRGRAMYSAYSSVKAALVNLAQALAEELVYDRIRVNVISPERCATPMRFKAFGSEPKDSLISPKNVAVASLKTFLSDLNGQVIDVRHN